MSGVRWPTTAPLATVSVRSMRSRRSRHAVDVSGVSTGSVRTRTRVLVFFWSTLFFDGQLYNASDGETHTLFDLAASVNNYNTDGRDEAPVNSLRVSVPLPASSEFEPMRPAKRFAGGAEPGRGQAGSESGGRRPLAELPFEGDTVCVRNNSGSNALQLDGGGGVVRVLDGGGDGKGKDGGKDRKVSKSMVLHGDGSKGTRRLALSPQHALPCAASRQGLWSVCSASGYFTSAARYVWS